MLTGLKLGAEQDIQRRPWGVRRVIVNRDGDALALRQPRWRACFDAVAELIAATGVKVINCSEVSALETYPKRSLREALAC